jgi:hypothetical protein
MFKKISTKSAPPTPSTAVSNCMNISEVGMCGQSTSLRVCIENACKGQRKVEDNKEDGRERSTNKEKK